MVHYIRHQRIDIRPMYYITNTHLPHTANPIIVFFIADANSINTYSTNTGFFTPTSRCIFTLEDFTAVSIDVALEINPQKVIGVSCVPLPSTSSASSSGFAYYSSVATYGYPSATGAYTVSSVPAPYPTATGVYSAVGPSTTGTGVTPGGQSNVPFTGDAGRVGAGFGGLIGALIGAGFLL